MPRIEVAGKELDVPVRVSARAKRARIVVDWNRSVEVVVPPRARRGTAERVLAEQRGWLERQLARPVKPFLLGLQRNDAVWLHGESSPLPEAPSLERWYRAQARREIAAAVEREGARLGIEHGGVSIRDQRTRWGSCSARGVLSFNWRLVLAPREVLDYVVVHELCHRRRHDHSPAFWRLVRAARPGYEAERAWLREHGRELLAYRVPAAWSGGRPSTATGR